MTWQVDLEAALRRLAEDYDEVSEDLEAGATEIRHAGFDDGVSAVAAVLVGAA